MSIRFVSALLHAAKNIETAIITCPIEDGHDGDDGDDGDGARRMFEAEMGSILVGFHGILMGFNDILWDWIFSWDLSMNLDNGVSR